MTPVNLDEITKHTDLFSLIRATVEYIQDNHKTMDETDIHLHLMAIEKATGLLIEDWSE